MELGLMMFLGLVQITPLPRYEEEHFYYRDKMGVQRPLLFKDQIFVTQKANVEKLNKNYEVFPRHDGYLVKSEKLFMRKLMSDFNKKRVDYLPVVNWQGVNSVPRNTIHINTKPFVTLAMLRAKLKSIGGFEVFAINPDKSKPFTYFVMLEKLVLPPNIIVIANMLSEDTAWFNWAQVLFNSLDDPIVAKMQVNEVNGNLGVTRFLELVIKISDPKVKLRKDLLPVFGQGVFTFVKQDWMDVEPSTVVETEEDGVTTVIVKYPFRYFHIGSILLPSANVSYDYEGDARTVHVVGLLYINTSVIAGTKIDDLQPINCDYQVGLLAKPVEFTPVASFTKASLVAIWLAIGLWMLVIGVLVLRLRNTPLPKNELQKQKIIAKLDELIDLVKLPRDFDIVQLRSVYLQIEAVVLNASHLFCAGNEELMLELQKVYKEKPDYDLVTLHQCLVRFNLTCKTNGKIMSHAKMV